MTFREDKFEKIEWEATKNAGYLAGLRFFDTKQAQNHSCTDPELIAAWKKGYKNALKERGVKITPVEPNELGMTEE